MERERLLRSCLAWVWFALLMAGAPALADQTQDVPRRHYTLANPKDEVIGGNYFRHRVTAEDTLILLARDNHLGFNEIMLANPDQDPWSPRIGSKIRLDFRKVLPGLNNPARIVVNLPEMRLYHFRGNRVDTYPIGVGQEGMMTPRVRATVTSKMAGPTWRPPPSIRKEDPSLPEAIPPGPRNPLGTHAIYLTLPAYLIHGTNRPLGVGRRVSHGCIRLYPEDIIDFFPNVNAGDSVAFVNEPVKAGWRGEELYLEVHPALAELKWEGSLQTMMQKAITQALARRPNIQAEVDWRLAERMVANPDGQSRRVAASSTAVATAAERQAALTIPDIPEEQTIPEAGLRLPDLEQLDREDGNSAALAGPRAVRGGNQAVTPTASAPDAEPPPEASPIQEATPVQESPPPAALSEPAPVAQPAVPQPPG
ncbi:MAG: L,D-transpeptidase family protein [Magnetococcales bacterium]|nr:L,D-transpeptidase family protein [Magnetococcales bacterium]